MKTAIEVANYFIQKGVEEVRPLTHLKLQKLLYVAYGWYYAQFDKRLFDEVLQAWKYGPVVHSVYLKLKHFGDRCIETELSEEDEDIPGRYHTPMLRRKKDGDIIKFLDDIWDGYAKFTAIELTNYSHVKGSPWHQLVEHMGSIPKYQDLGDQAIKEYFISERTRVDGFNPGK